MIACGAGGQRRAEGREPMGEHEQLGVVGRGREFESSRWPGLTDRARRRAEIHDARLGHWGALRRDHVHSERRRAAYLPLDERRCRQGIASPGVNRRGRSRGLGTGASVSLPIRSRLVGCWLHDQDQHDQDSEETNQG